MINEKFLQNSDKKIKIVVNSSDERYVGILENGNIKMPSYSIAIVK